jgi:hypothetical protein
MISGVFVDASKEDEQTRNSMLRVAAFIVGVCLSASAVARADSPAVQTTLDAAKQADFDSFVVMGKRAQLAGRYQEAATAYKAALDIQPHPVIAGRYGLMLMKLGHLDKAADELLDAHQRGQGVFLQERREVAAAYDKAKALTTWVTVNVSQVGAMVTCDGEPWNREGISSFWHFAMPGEHTLRAKLDGYEEAVETFTAKPGDEITISLRLVPIIKLVPIPEDEPILRKKKRYFPPPFNSSNVWGSPDYEPKEDPNHGEPKETKPAPKKDGPRFSVNGGVVTVFGVASWNPAVGGVVGVSVKPKEFFSLGIEGRAAWLTTGVAGLPISAMTAGGILSACGHLKWFFGCGLGYVGTINVEFSDLVYTGKSASFVQPGFGGRIGIETRLGSAFILRATGDVIGMSRGIQLSVGNSVVASQAPVMAGVQISGGWEF